jgi:hypothetical protein
VWVEKAKSMTWSSVKNRRLFSWIVCTREEGDDEIRAASRRSEETFSLSRYDIPRFHTILLDLFGPS